jgi:hypothetical protein
MPDLEGLRKTLQKRQQTRLAQEQLATQAAELRALGVLPAPADHPIYQQGQTVLITPSQADPQSPSVTTRVLFGMQPPRRTPPEESP